MTSIGGADVPFWSNKDLVAYHGTDSASLAASTGFPLPASGHALTFSISLALCRPYTDFGQGFYLTTSLHQAEQWANKRVATMHSSSSAPPTVATILQFSLSRDWLASLESLAFVLETADFWALVNDCRSRFPPHQRIGPSREYDVVYGPISLWPQKLVIKDCDQISFHTPKATGTLPHPIILKKADDIDPRRTSF